MKKLCQKVMITSFAAAMVSLCGCSSSSDAAGTAAVAYNEATTPHYDVVKRDAKATIDAKLDDEVWKDVPDISGGFHFPWDTKEVPLTKFQGYHDGTDFYFCFEVTDEMS